MNQFTNWITSSSNMRQNVFVVTGDVRPRSVSISEPGTQCVWIDEQVFFWVLQIAT